MDLQQLIEKYGLKEGDTVECVNTYNICYTKGIKILKHYGIKLGFWEGHDMWQGTSAEFQLPEDSPYLKPKHEFVRSCQPNTAENQKALFALGYAWLSRAQNVTNLEYNYLFTNTDGGLTYGSTNSDNDPQRYNFETVTTTTATLLPEEPVETESQRELRQAREELEAVTDKLKALEEKLDAK